MLLLNSYCTVTSQFAVIIHLASFISSELQSIYEVFTWFFYIKIRVKYIFGPYDLPFLSKSSLDFQKWQIWSTWFSSLLKCSFCPSLCMKNLQNFRHMYKKSHMTHKMLPHIHSCHISISLKKTNKLKKKKNLKTKKKKGRGSSRQGQNQNCVEALNLRK